MRPPGGVHDVLGGGRGRYEPPRGRALTAVNSAVRPGQSAPPKLGAYHAFAGGNNPCKSIENLSIHLSIIY